MNQSDEYGNKSKGGFEYKIHEFQNTYDHKQADFIGKLDHELVKLRNDINSQYLGLNDKLHKLKFQAERQFQRRDEERRDFDKIQEHIYNSSFSR